MSDHALPADFTKSPNVQSPVDKKSMTTAQNKVEKGVQDHVVNVEDAPHILASLGQSRKNLLLLIFSVATFVDVCK